MFFLYPTSWILTNISVKMHNIKLTLCYSTKTIAAWLLAYVFDTLTSNAVLTSQNSWVGGRTQKAWPQTTLEFLQRPLRHVRARGRYKLISFFTHNKHILLIYGCFNQSNSSQESLKFKASLYASIISNTSYTWPAWGCFTEVAWAPWRVHLSLSDGSQSLAALLDISSNPIPLMIVCFCIYFAGYQKPTAGLMFSLDEWAIICIVCLVLVVIFLWYNRERWFGTPSSLPFLALVHLDKEKGPPI